eukprot:Skav210394  [mRNA]  locus=scaffold1416:13477:24645:+ [translate_table: standard]
MDSAYITHISGIRRERFAEDDLQKYTWNIRPSARVEAIYTEQGRDLQRSGYVTSGRERAQDNFNLKCRAAPLDLHSNALSFVKSTDEIEDESASVLDTSAFYAEAGGQADGKEVMKVKVFAGYVLHTGPMPSSLKVGDQVFCEVDYEHRGKVAPNHTMTHVLNWALREVLGDGLDQRGSLVTADRLRFDFSYEASSGVSVESLEKVEALVQKTVDAGLPVTSKEVALADAQAIYGLRAMAGEAYPDPVRVEVLADPGAEKWMSQSVEFCGWAALTLEPDEAQVMEKRMKDLENSKEDVMMALQRDLDSLVLPAVPKAQLRDRVDGKSLRQAAQEGEFDIAVMVLNQPRLVKMKARKKQPSTDPLADSMAEDDDDDYDPFDPEAIEADAEDPSLPPHTLPMAEPSPPAPSAAAAPESEPAQAPAPKQDPPSLSHALRSATVQKGVADNTETLPMTTEQVQEAVEAATTAASPLPSQSPDMTSSQRREQYQGSCPKDEPAPGPDSNHPNPPAEPAAVKEAWSKEVYGLDYNLWIVPSVPDTAAEAAKEDFVGRDEQLRYKQAKKSTRRAGGKKKGKKGKGKKGKGKKAGTKGKGVSPTKSRKRRILSTGSSAEVSKKKRKAKKEAEVEGDGDATGDAAPAPKVRSQKTKDKAVVPKSRKKAAKADEEEPKVPKAKAKAKAEAKAKASAKKRGRKVRNAGSELMSNPLRENSLVRSLMAFAKQFPESLEGNPEGLKKAIREAQSPLEWTKLMPYWTRCGCGVKILNDDGKTYRDIHNFSFQSSSPIIYFPVAEAMGIDTETYGYEKDGSEILKLKVNGALSLFFFANEDENDLDNVD